MALSVTHTELLEALSTASQAPEDALAVQDIVRMTGVNAVAVRKLLCTYEREGRLTLHRVIRRRLDGCMTSVPAYTIKPKAPQ